MKRWESYVWPLLAVGFVLALWHFGVVWSKTQVFPSPFDIQKGMAELIRKGLLARYTGDSLLRVAAGYLTAVVLGIPIGLLLGWYPRAAEAANPLIQMMRPISPLAWIPLAIVWFG
ncbi:MAG: ABC transporter permease, partial [Bryobacteraceae bacterium]